MLEPATGPGALPLALHPVMTFTGRPDDVDRLAGISFGVTAPDALRPVAEVLVMEMGGEPVFIAEEYRGLYHAALAGAANHLVTQVVQACDLLAIGRRRQPRADARAAAVRGPGQLAAAGRRGADRAGRARRRRHRRRSPGRAAGGRAGGAARLPRAGPADRDPGAWPPGMLAAPDAQRLLDVLAEARR